VGFDCRCPGSFCHQHVRLVVHEAGQRSFIEDWIQKFIDKNPKFFSPKKLFHR
jgi:hypothetical protein